jgi:hypothetical protein
MKFDKIDEKRFKALIKQISGTISASDGALQPYHKIKGTGFLFCYSVTDKSLIRVIRDSTVYVLDWGKEDDNECLVYTDDGALIIIEKEEILKIGFD